MALAALALVVFGAIECPPPTFHYLRINNTTTYAWGYDTEKKAVPPNAVIDSTCYF